MTLRSVPELPVEALGSWPTKRLLGRLEALRRVHESPVTCDSTSEEIAAEEGIAFKSDSRWRIAYSDVKALLDTREHVRRGKAARLERVRGRDSS